MNSDDFQGSLKDKAFDPKDSKGRRYALDYHFKDLDLSFVAGDPFALDIVKILNSKASRRLAEKTQVYPLPFDPHIRTRLIHSMEVCSLALQIADVLGLNKSLCQAIGLGHDLGHAPFGHFGEQYITVNTGKKFAHAVNSVVVCQRVERRGHGLNLTRETLQGILSHSRAIEDRIEVSSAGIQEFSVIVLADKLAYTFADYNDYLRVKGKEAIIPPNLDFFGPYQRARVYKCLQALFEESAELGCVSFKNSQTAKEFARLRKWMLVNVYEQISFDVERVLFDKLIEYFRKESFFQGWDPYLLLALMTDREVRHFGQLWNNARHPKIEEISHYGIIELVERVDDPKIDFSQPDLGW